MPSRKFKKIAMALAGALALGSLTLRNKTYSKKNFRAQSPAEKNYERERHTFNRFRRHRSRDLEAYRRSKLSLKPFLKRFKLLEAKNARSFESYRAILELKKYGIPLLYKGNKLFSFFIDKSGFPSLIELREGDVLEYGDGLFRIRRGSEIKEYKNENSDGEFQQAFVFKDPVSGKIIVSKSMFHSKVYYTVEELSAFSKFLSERISLNLLFTKEGDGLYFFVNGRKYLLRENDRILIEKGVLYLNAVPIAAFVEDFGLRMYIDVGAAFFSYNAY